MSKDKKGAMVGTWLLTLFLLSLILANPGRVLAADAFLKVDGIEGESTDSKHAKQIDIITWSFGETNSGTLSSAGGGGGAGKVNMKGFTINKKVCKASPKLFLACATGQHLKEVSLEVCKSAEGRQPFLKVKLSEVIVSSFVNLGSPGSPYPTEEVIFNFGKIEITYTELDKTGKAMGDTKAGYDVTANKKM